MILLSIIDPRWREEFAYARSRGAGPLAAARLATSARKAANMIGGGAR